MFAVGIVLLASAALLPPCLQNLRPGVPGEAQVEIAPELGTAIGVAQVAPRV